MDSIRLYSLSRSFYCRCASFDLFCFDDNKSSLARRAKKKNVDSPTSHKQPLGLVDLLHRVQVYKFRTPVEAEIKALTKLDNSRKVNIRKRL